MVRFVFIPKWQFHQDMEDQLMTVSQDLEGRKRARNHGGEESYVTHRRSRIDRERLTPLSLSFDFRVINLAICFSPITRRRRKTGPVIRWTPSEEKRAENSPGSYFFELT